MKENEVRDQSAKEVEKAWQTRPEIGNEKHGIVNEVRNDSVDLKAEIAATRDSLQTGKTLDTGRHHPDTTEKFISKTLTIWQQLKIRKIGPEQWAGCGENACDEHRCERKDFH